jgi:hypothetical protein
MEKAGFPSPTTVANFLIKGELADSAVIVVDEAGQIGGRQMLELVRLIHERHGRLVFSGDTRQHGAVEASDALLTNYKFAPTSPLGGRYETGFNHEDGLSGKRRTMTNASTELRRVRARQRAELRGRIVPAKVPATPV